MLVPRPQIEVLLQYKGCQIIIVFSGEELPPLVLYLVRTIAVLILNKVFLHTLTFKVNKYRQHLQPISLAVS